jgi:hypothetical protein
MQLTQYADKRKAAMTRLAAKAYHDLVSRQVMMGTNRYGQTIHKFQAQCNYGDLESRPKPSKGAVLPPPTSV